MGARGPLKLVAPSPDPAVAPKPGGPDTAASMMTPSAPEKPEKLPGEVSELWDTIVDSLDKAGMIARCDGPTMELALRHFVAARVASDEIIYGSATMHDDKNDRPMKNPGISSFPRPLHGLLGIREAAWPYLRGACTHADKDHG